MPQTAHAVDTSHKHHAHAAATLTPSLEAAKELARALSEIPEDSALSRHPDFAMARAMTLTVIDMLEEIARDAERRGHHHRHGHDHGHHNR